MGGRNVDVSWSRPTNEHERRRKRIPEALALLGSRNGIASERRPAEEIRLQLQVPTADADGAR